MLSAKWCPQNTVHECPQVSVGVRECPWVSASVREILFTKYSLPNSSDKLISWTISREMLSAKWCPRVSPSVRGCPRVSTKVLSRNTVCQIANILQVTSWLVEIFQAKCCLQNDVRKILSTSVRKCLWVSASVRGCPQVSAKFLFTKYSLPNSSDKLISWTISREMLSAKWCPRVSVGVHECPRNFYHEILSAKLQIFFKWQVD